MKIAVIQSGGKQYIVTDGKKVELEKLEAEEGSQVAFETLLIASDDAKTFELGQPAVSTQVKGKVVKNYRGDKVSVIKYKRKVRYRRNRGHRQHHTMVEIGKI